MIFDPCIPLGMIVGKTLVDEISLKFNLKYKEIYKSFNLYIYVCLTTQNTKDIYALEFQAFLHFLQTHPGLWSHLFYNYLSLPISSFHLILFYYFQSHAVIPLP